MAVAKSRKSRSRRGMKRAHMKHQNPTLSIDPETGEVHRRHHVTPKGFYRGRQIVADNKKPTAESTEG